MSSISIAVLSLLIMTSSVNPCGIFLDVLLASFAGNLQGRKSRRFCFILAIALHATMFDFGSKADEEGRGGGKLLLHLLPASFLCLSSTLRLNFFLSSTFLYFRKPKWWLNFPYKITERSSAKIRPFLNNEMAAKV